MVKKLTKRTKKFEATKLKGVIQHRRKYQKQKRQRTKKSGNSKSTDEKEFNKQEKFTKELVSNDNSFKPKLKSSKQEKPEKKKSSKKDFNSDETALEDSFFVNDSEEEMEFGSDGEYEGEEELEFGSDDDFEGGGKIDGEEEEEEEEKEDFKSHKEELEYLKKKDPEFVKFLEENDKELLEFDDEEVEMEEGDALDEVERIVKKPKILPPLTISVLKKWEEQAEKNSLNAAKKLLVAFRSASHLADEEIKDLKVYQINTSNVFNRVVSFCLKNMTKYLLYHLGIPEDTPEKDLVIKIRKLTPTSKQVKPMVKSYIGNIVHFLDQMTEPKMLTFVLKYIQSLVPFFSVFPKIAKRFIKILTNIWSTSEQTPKILAFLNMRAMAMNMPYPFINICLKGIYLNYIRNAKFVNPQSSPLIEFMATSVVELYSLDYVAAYQHAFVYIRQLAIHLRNSIQQKTKTAYQNVYNWQFINSLKVWCLWVENNPAQELVSLLIYPLVQILIGTITLIPTSKYFPLRFNCIRLLHRLSKATKVFVNTVPYTVETLNSSELNHTKKKSGIKGVDFTFSIKVTKSALQTKAFQDTVVGNVFELVLEFFTIHSRSISYPELVIPSLGYLKNFKEKTKVNNFKKKISLLMDLLSKNSNFITSKRRSVSFSPKDTEEAQAFLNNLKESTPLEKYYAAYIQSEEYKQRLNYYDSSQERRNQDEEDDENDANEDEEEESNDEEMEKNKKNKKTKKNKISKYSKDEEEENQENNEGENYEGENYEGENYEGEDNGDIVEDLIVSDSD